jgi:accessory Sec system S-layer assembly protein
MALFKKKQKTQEENTTSNNTATIQEEHTINEEPELVKTELSFHPEWELTNQEKYVYKFRHEQLPLLRLNQISITGIKLIEYNDGFVAVAFLRNTLPKSIRFEAVDLLLLDENGQAIAKKQFDLDGVGELPSNACRPWRFLFSNEDKLIDGNLEEEKGWKIAFELKSSSPSKHSLDMDENWKNQITPEQNKYLENLVQTLPSLANGEINIMGLEAKFVNNHDLAVTLLIRNGNEKNIKLEQLPLIVEDATGEEICKGGFKLDNFEVKANTSKPWTFIFPNELVIKKNPDLSKWKVFTPSK